MLDVQGGVQVSIDESAAALTRKPAVGKRQVVERAAHAVPLARWEEPINPRKHLTGPLGLVRQWAKELAPSSVMHTLGASRSRQHRRAHVFDHDALVLGNQSRRALVEEVGTRIVAIHSCRRATLRDCFW